MKRLSLLLLCLVGLLLAGCEETPDYVGVWVDATTLVDDGTVVTLDLEADRAIITIDYADADPREDVVVVGTIKKSGSTITTTINQIVVGTALYIGSAVDIFLSLLTPPLTRVNTFTYSVVGDTLTITGEMISALTINYSGGPQDTLVAIRT